MNPLVFHIASGQSFFSGVALLVLAALLSTRQERLAKRVGVLVCLIGLTAVIVSSTAIPYWYYAIAAIITVVWGVLFLVNRWRRWAAVALAAVWAVAALIEVPYHITPGLTPADSRALVVIGDSVSAGMHDNDVETWPSILARTHNWTFAISG
ncbi:MAG TPA: hypothetical protein VMY42_05160 [Thermoguttaceae bacterium]|nr:hypothetical protein [Thermoguttaceae bacterium]